MVWVPVLGAWRFSPGPLPLGRLGPGQGHCFRSGVEGGETGSFYKKGVGGWAVCRAGPKSAVFSLSFAPCPERRLNKQL